jgi:hypothetical protein
METDTIIYLVAFALILRIIVRLVVKYRREQKNDIEAND